MASRSTQSVAHSVPNHSQRNDPFKPFPPKPARVHISIYILCHSFVSCPWGPQANPKTRTSSFNTQFADVFEEKRYFTPDQREETCVWVCSANRHTVLTPVENMVVLDNDKLEEAHCYRTGCNPHRDCKGTLCKCTKKELLCVLLESFPALEERLGISTARPAKAPTSSTSPQLEEESLISTGRWCCALPADQQCGGRVGSW